MKKTLIAFAVLSASAATASAQSYVTVYGSIDAGIRNVTNVNAAGDSKLAMGGATPGATGNGISNSNRLGFKGQEDLGGGMNAHFVLESGFNTGTGTLDSAAMFNRSAFVGVTGEFGNIDLGRQYSLAFKTIGTYEPFNFKFPSVTSPVAGVALFYPAAATRFNNDIQYTAILSGVKVSAEYSLGEQAGDMRKNSVKSVAATYATGPLNFGGTYMSGDNNGFGNKYYTVGGAYKEAGVRVSFGYVKEIQETLSKVDSEQKSYWGGVSYAISPQVELTGAYYVTKATVAKIDSDRKNLVLAATYSLSKRTNFYVEADNRKLTNALTALPLTLSSGSINTGTQNGLSIGIMHLF
ncbi:porin [Undibacterium sp. Xuan67W]|uniref:porin n=1 Tax=Undibacterium sp. Xuan67W TaxID=3413057 RepID=UPI003BF26DEA